MSKNVSYKCKKFREIAFKSFKFCVGVRKINNYEKPSIANLNL